MTQAELGRRVGLSQPTIAELEGGKSAGSTQIASIASALRVNPLWLETGKGSKESGQEHGQAGLTAQEEELLASYRSASDAERDLFISISNSVRRRLLADGTRKKV